MLVTSFCFLTLPQAVITATIASDQTLSKYKLWIMVSVLSAYKAHFSFCDKKLFAVSTLVLPLRTNLDGITIYGELFCSLHLSCTILSGERPHCLGNSKRDVMNALTQLYVCVYF